MSNNKDWTGSKKTTFVTLGASNHTDHDRAEYDYYATTMRTELLRKCHLLNVMRGSFGKKVLKAILLSSG